MAPHPTEQDTPQEHEADTGAPNPSRLPVEPEFGPRPPVAEPEDPLAKPSHVPI
jgi:hypothetical protein